MNAREDDPLSAFKGILAACVAGGLLWLALVVLFLAIR